MRDLFGLSGLPCSDNMLNFCSSKKIEFTSKEGEYFKKDTRKLIINLQRMKLNKKKISALIIILIIIQLKNIYYLVCLVKNKHSLVKKLTALIWHPKSSAAALISAFYFFSHIVSASLLTTLKLLKITKSVTQFLISCDYNKNHKLSTVKLVFGCSSNLLLESVQFKVRNKFSKNIAFILYTVRLLLVSSGDVELNPGPENKELIKILTYNINGGLAKPSKQKRLLNKIKRLKGNYIICLQETHLTIENEFVFKSRWANGMCVSHGTSSSAGTAILYKISECSKVTSTSITQLVLFSLLQIGGTDQ